MPRCGWTILAPWLLVPSTDTSGGLGVVVVVGLVVVVDSVVEGLVVVEDFAASFSGSSEQAATSSTDATITASSTRPRGKVLVVATPSDRMVPSVGTIVVLPKSATLCGQVHVGRTRPV